MSNEATAATTAAGLLEALQAAGVEVIFANLGSDHPALIEALALSRSRGETVPAVVLTPHEATALAAAHGYTLVTGRAQAVFVHVDVGTANLGGAVSNAARSSIPVLIFAGLTPYTLEGELPGTRNSYVNHLQEVRNQSSIVSPYVKWSYDVRTGANVRQVILRAFQIAETTPRGPVYVTAAREVLAEVVSGRSPDPARWRPAVASPAPADVVAELVESIASARFPILVTSYLGRDPEAVGRLERLAATLGLGVVEAVPSAVNFPADNPLHIGFASEPLLDRADVVIAMDTQAPWMISRRGPAEGAWVYFVDADPVKLDLPLWYVESDVFVRADSATVLEQLVTAAEALKDRGLVDERKREFGVVHDRQRAEWMLEGAGGSPLDPPTVEDVCSALMAVIDDDTVVLNEAISNSDRVMRHLPRRRPGTMFASGGTSLGWSGGAAVGMKLAHPSRDIVTIVGDGTFFLTVPSSTYWTSARYGAPFFTIVLDNGGWNATKQNLIRQHGGGRADDDDSYWVNLAQASDLAGIAAAAGGAFARTVEAVGGLREAFGSAIDATRGGRSAVVRVLIPAISAQPADVVKGAAEPTPAHAPHHRAATSG